MLERVWKPEACGQPVLPDRSVLIGQKLVENAKVKRFKWDILSNFQTTCCSLFSSLLTYLRNVKSRGRRISSGLRWKARRDLSALKLWMRKLADLSLNQNRTNFEIW